MTQKMFIPLISVVATSACDTGETSSGGNDRAVGVEALSVVPVAVEGPPRVGSLIELKGLENTVDDKSKCNIKKLVMSETLMWIRYMVRDISVGLVPESLVGR